VTDHPHIVLIGMMASGKTTVGRMLAGHLDRPLVDLDSVLIDRMGCSVTEAFERNGEPWFRVQESAVLAEVLARDEPQIVSPGGGIVLAGENRSKLAERARCVWLRATPETIIQRVGGGGGRPLLAGNLEQRVHKLNAERRLLYEAAADSVIDVDDLTTPQAFRDLC
jgi:shikimate kinase